KVGPASRPPPRNIYRPPVGHRTEWTIRSQMRCGLVAYNEDDGLRLAQSRAIKCRREGPLDRFEKLSPCGAEVCQTPTAITVGVPVGLPASDVCRRFQYSRDAFARCHTSAVLPAARASFAKSMASRTANSSLIYSP